MQSKRKQKYAALLSLIAIAATTATAGAAPSLPTPGSQVADKLPGTQAQVENTVPAENAGKPDVKFTLKGITIEAGDVEADNAALQALVAKYIGHEITMGDLNEAAAAVTAYCRSHGYPAAAAYMPEQTAKDGILVMKLMVGRYGDIRIDNASHLDKSVAENLSCGLKSGDIIRSKSLETVLYNVSGLGGIQAAGILSPGKKIGTSDVTIRIRDGKQHTFILYSENYGSKSSGRYRYGMQDIIADYDGRGSQLSLSGLISNSRLRNYSVSDSILVGHSGTKLGISFGRTDYELNGEFRNLGAQGKADTFSLFGSTPLWRTNASSLSVNYGYDYRNLTDDIMDMSAKKHSHSFHVGLNGYGRSGHDALDYGVTLYTGFMGLDSEYAELLDASSHTSGHYTKGVVELNGVHTFNERWDVLLKGEVQKASHNLDSSEDIYLGGANGVRAYPQGEASGDEGWVGTAELRYRTDVPGLTLSTYLDGGQVRLSRDGTSGSETLKGWGIGIAYSMPGDWFARFDYARRIGSDDKMSDEAQSNARMWFMLGKIW